MENPQEEAGGRPQNAEEVVKVLCILHHCLMDERAGRYCAADYADSVNAVGEWRGGQWRHLLAQPPVQVAHTRARNFAQMAYYVRDMYKQYFNTGEDTVSWQSAVLWW